VSLRTTFVLKSDGGAPTSDSTVRLRRSEELTDSLSEAEFTVQEVGMLSILLAENSGSSPNARSQSVQSVQSVGLLLGMCPLPG
jgi:hypothetical protein